jgi:signal transduction histidine kinase
MPAAYVYFLFAAALIFLQKTVEVGWDARLLGRSLRSVPLFALAGHAFLYSVVIFVSLQFHAKAASYAFFCALPVIGSLKQRAYVMTLRSTLGLEDRVLRVTGWAFLALAVTFVTGWLAWAFWGFEVILRDTPNPRTNPMLVAMGLDRFTPTAFTMAMSALFLGFTIHAQLRILNALRRSKNPDPFLVLGIFATLAFLVNETLGGLGLVNSASFLFLAESLEILRLGARLRQQAQLRIETLERDVNALTPMAQLGLFVGAIAHDIRNPLAVIKASAQNMEILPIAPDTPSKTSALVDRTLRAVGRIDAIVDRYLAFAHDSGAVDAAPTPLRPIIGKALAHCRAPLEAAGSPSIAIEIKDDIEIRANPLLLESLFVNLISNAATALRGRSAPELVIRADMLPEKCVINVRDNGPGIVPEHRENLFTRCWTTNTDGHGTGLGLRIVHQIVSRHNGQIRLKDSPVGACFEIVFPRD